MAKIRRTPSQANYFLVDACFLVNRYLRLKWLTDPGEIDVVRACHEWWEEIDRQVKSGKAIVYVPDVCIAEAFKALSKKYYDKTLDGVAVKQAKDRLRRDIQLPADQARKYARRISFHDIDTNRDIIISVDRFFERAHKDVSGVGIIDLLYLSAGKYLMDFYGFTRKNLFMVTVDKRLHKLACLYGDIPRAFNPQLKSQRASKVFT